MPHPASSRKQPPSASPYLLPGSYSPARPLPPTSPAGTLPLSYSHARGPSPAPSSHYGPSAAGSDVGYSYPARGYSNVPVDEHRHAPAGWNSTVPAQRYASPAPPTFVPPPTSQLPHFEAALARARGYAPPTPSHASSPAPSNISYNPTPYHQPSYTSITSADPNHPEVSISMRPSSTVRFSGPPAYNRGYSRSPTPPLMDDVDEKSPKVDIESPLIASMENGYGLEDPPVPAQWRHSADGDLAGGYADEDEKRPFSSYTKKEDEMPPSSTQHFGPAPEGRVSRRNKQTHRQLKEVTLDDRNWNNFVIDAKIPTRLAQCMPVKGVEEQSTTRYTAITSSPDDLPLSGFRLRQNSYDPPRQTELFIVITMYNEDAQLFCRTLYGVMKNISHLCSRKNSKVWGKDGWKKIVVCIVADGRKSVNPRVLDCLAALGVFQEGVMTNMVQDKPVVAHVFEYTTSFALDSELHFKYPDKGIVPCQIIFCLKEKNARKINSHRWFFNGFAPLLSPNITILLDVGTRPAPKSLYHLWKAFDKNSNVGGACGEIATFKGKTWRGLLNPLVAAQCFEYKMSNILDKPMESIFGYCTVLPGAFSAYRYIALQNDAQGRGPLASYFRGEEMLAGKADTFTANIAKPKASWVLKYVKQAVGETDCPDSIPEFISQRRRWLNGSFMAAVYSLWHIAQMLRSDHSFMRKTALMLESAYNAINLIFTWFSLGNYYIFFVILTSSLESSTFNIKNIAVLNKIAQYGYLGAVVACFIFSMGNRPQGSAWKYKSTVYFFALLTAYMLVCAVLCAVQAVKHVGEPIYAQMIVSLASTYGVFVVSSLMALDPWHLITCFAQYILFSPTYINILNVYAYSNLHDLSWGTKGADTVQEVDLGAVKGIGRHVKAEVVTAQVDIDVAYQDALDNIRLKREKVDDSELPPAKGGVSEQQQKDIYANFRTNLLLLWSLSNALLASVILSGQNTSETFNGGSTRTGVYMLAVLIFVAGMALFRFLGAAAYLIVTLFGG